MVLNQYAAILAVVSANAISVVRRSAGPSISPSSAQRLGSPVCVDSRLCLSQTSDSGIWRRISTTIKAGSAEIMKLQRQPIHGASE